MRVQYVCVCVHVYVQTTHMTIIHITITTQLHLVLWSGTRNLHLWGTSSVSDKPLWWINTLAWTHKIGWILGFVTNESLRKHLPRIVVEPTDEWSSVTFPYPHTCFQNWCRNQRSVRTDFPTCVQTSAIITQHQISSTIFVSDLNTFTLGKNCFQLFP